ncbi:hypothetical protein EDD16DRAFT_69153 [Pisolithus croceorrhizus]|nr:hypothetical protein EDD16DRAFT_69153 [Pisolithus croceorrhizus]KAI6149089.1 hypothetical protein EDD17DRAFT_1209591 [Pisolithus thermaeus]
MYSHSPALKCLELAGLDRPLPASSLTDGLLGNSTPHGAPRVISAESLTTLSLAGNADGWEFPRDSIHFPILESLTLGINDPMSFSEATIAPKLECFEFSKARGTRLVCRRFNGSTSKFDNVYRLTVVPSPSVRSSKDALYMTKEFCEVFRGVRHANFHMTCILSPLFSSCALTPHDDHHFPIDNWPCLESLEIRGFSFIQLESCKYFVEWVSKRRTSRQRKLHLKLVSDDSGTSLLTIQEISNTYQVLQQCCASVELYRMPASSRRCLYTSAGSLLLSPPVLELGPARQCDLIAPARACPAQTVEALLVQHWTL